MTKAATTRTQITRKRCIKEISKVQETRNILKTSKMETSKKNPAII